jgi:hypothetical protein
MLLRLEGCDGRVESITAERRGADCHSYFKLSAVSEMRLT